MRKMGETSERLFVAAVAAVVNVVACVCLCLRSGDVCDEGFSKNE